jgi:hypothetical protein
LVKTWIPEVTYQKVLVSLGINRSVEEIKEALSKTEKEFKKPNYRSMYGKVSYIEYWEKWDSLMNQLLPVLKAAVLGQKGPLKEGEIERTKEYARELAIKLKEDTV